MEHAFEHGCSTPHLACFHSLIYDAQCIMHSLKIETTLHRSFPHLEDWPPKGAGMEYGQGNHRDNGKLLSMFGEMRPPKFI